MSPGGSPGASFPREGCVVDPFLDLFGDPFWPQPRDPPNGSETDPNRIAKRIQNGYASLSRETWVRGSATGPVWGSVGGSVWGSVGGSVLDPFAGPAELGGGWVESQTHPKTDPQTDLKRIFRKYSISRVSRQQIVTNMVVFEALSRSQFHGAAQVAAQCMAPEDVFPPSLTISAARGL